MPVAAGPQKIILQQERPTAFGRYGKWLILALVVCVATIFGQAASYESYFSPPGGPVERFHSLNGDAEKKIALLKIEGAILDPEGFIKQQIDRIRSDEDVAAVVLRIDSPGGTVTASDYLYHHLRKLASERKLPMVVSMGGLCASGGYYLAMAPEAGENIVFAEPTTWTGSIGVMIPHYDLSGLLARWEVEDDSLASGEDKLMGSPTRQLSEEEKTRERELLQDLVDRSFERFKNIVLEARPKLKDDPEALKTATTGRIFTSEQAQELGLVDKIGFIDDAVARAAELAGVDATSARCVQYDQPPSKLEMLLGAKSPLGSSRGLDLSALFEMTAPRAYYLCSWLPSVVAN
jgi:protease-4